MRRQRGALARFRRPGQMPKAANILKSVSFTARGSEILAVAGPSGAGKSTLLRFVSGRLRNSGSEPGSVSFNDRVMSPTQLRKLCGYVTQDDNLLPLLTVEETLLFTSKFLLRGCNGEGRRERVDSLMEELGLTSVAKSYVGGDEVRGISGGERKRVSIAVDMIHNPLCFSSTSPRQGSTANRPFRFVIDLLASMAKTRGQILILTIHQPSYRILHYISTFLFLSQGSVAHLGNLSSLEEAIAGRVRHGDIAEAGGMLRRALVQEGGAGDPPERSDGGGYCGWWEEMSFLCWRFWKVMYRTKQLFLARTLQAVVGGIGLGSVFFGVSADAAGVAQRLGLFAFTLSFLLSSTVEGLPIFLQERRVLMREASREFFLPFLLVVSLLFSAPVYWLVGLNPSSGAFFFFTFMVWLIMLTASSVVLFLGAVSPDFILGNSLLCVFLAIFFLFSGYFIPKDSIPWYWMYMYYISIYRYPLDAMLVNEYWDARSKCFSWEDGGEENSRKWMNVCIMLGFFLFYRILAWAILLRRASKTML
ncbi:unnamed protein product [Spirodela intermedia]|uniref:ABC transporter domain-containing protein n=1 Tax=Spirodela intermedia TaxID=51605 RepID=A0A7I8IAV4_SPIIN|nr:unnamed protein product [Spirodela intermedia]CAA6654021.1 unnamed protein product [Spirodela intermedia]